MIRTKIVKKGHLTNRHPLNFTYRKQKPVLPYYFVAGWLAVVGQYGF